MTPPGRGLERAHHPRRHILINQEAQQHAPTQRRAPRMRQPLELELPCRIIQATSRSSSTSSYTSWPISRTALTTARFWMRLATGSRITRRGGRDCERSDRAWSGRCRPSRGTSLPRQCPLPYWGSATHVRARSSPDRARPPVGTCSCFARSCAPPLGTCKRFSRSCAPPLGTCSCFARSCAPPLGTCSCFARSCAPPLGTRKRFSRSCASPLGTLASLARSPIGELRMHASPTRGRLSELRALASLFR